MSDKRAPNGTEDEPKTIVEIYRTAHRLLKQLAAKWEMSQKSALSRVLEQVAKTEGITNETTEQ